MVSVTGNYSNLDHLPFSVRNILLEQISVFEKRREGPYVVRVQSTGTGGIENGLNKRKGAPLP